MPGCIGHDLQRWIEVPNRYVILVRWQSLEAHIMNRLQPIRRFMAHNAVPDAQGVAPGPETQTRRTH